MDTEKIFFITSGAFVNSELASDFGLLPTSFLPVGHKRLFENQIELIKDFDGEKYISIPQNYKLLERDLKILKKHSIHIYRSSANITLNNSLLSFLNTRDLNKFKEFYILHGDTLYSKLDFKTNLVYYNSTNMFYKWGNLREITNKIDSYPENSIVSGYFSFDNLKLLKLCLQENLDFVSALGQYNRTIHFNFEIGENWLDFGHSNLYYKSKVRLNVTRYFNKTEAKLNYIVKSSLDKSKIVNEFNWFNKLPENISSYSPSVWDLNSEKASYKIEFIGAPTLQEKWVFGNLPYKFYSIALTDVFNLIKKLSDHKYECDLENKKEILKKLYVEKTKNRVLEFTSKLDFNSNKEITINDKIYPTLNEFKKEVLINLNYRIDNITESGLNLMHGDLCFSNILLDNRSGSLKVIDPRGSLGDGKFNGNSNAGDYGYDVAKFGHSLIGNYDFIVTGFYNLDFDLKKYIFNFSLEKPVSNELKKLYYHKANDLGLSSTFVKSAITNLFLSMLPLHKEDKKRQLAFLINAYKFYYDL
mgnify:CR=1 FL=1